MPRLSQEGMQRRWAVLDQVHLRAEQQRLAHERNALMVSMHKALRLPDPVERKLQAGQIRERYNAIHRELHRVTARLDSIRRELAAE